MDSKRVYQNRGHDEDDDEKMKMMMMMMKMMMMKGYLSLSSGGRVCWGVTM